MPKTKILAAALIGGASLLAGCTAQVALINPSGGVSHLIAKKSDSSISGMVDGTPFAGTIITNESVGFGVGTATAGAATAAAFGTSISGGNAGRATLLAKNGDSIQCFFNYNMGKALGDCVRSDGTKYIFTTNPPN